jgi:hypothetical protein
VVHRIAVMLQHGVLTTRETGLELAHGCVSCTIRNDLMVFLRQLHRRDDVDGIVVHLACGASTAEIRDALEGALLTDDELACPQDWVGYEDPFGDWHEDPCAALAGEEIPAQHTQDGERG